MVIFSLAGRRGWNKMDSESIAFDFENGSGTYTYQGKIAGSFVSADTYLVIPEGVYSSMNPRGTAYGYLWVDCDKKDVASVEQKNTGCQTPGTKL